MKNSLVYLKFNNENFMKLPFKGCQSRYFAGMFVPLDRLIGEPLKKAKNLYKILPNLNYVDYKVSL